MHARGTPNVYLVFGGRVSADGGDSVFVAQGTLEAAVVVPGVLVEVGLRHTATHVCGDTETMGPMGVCWCCGADTDTVLDVCGRATATIDGHKGCVDESQLR
jgi:hypothetical protein